jgi:hypothetical protein
MPALHKFFLQTFLLLIGFFFTSPTLANTFVGNGGDVIFEKGRWRLYDLVEAGVGAGVVTCSSHSTAALRKTLSGLSKLGLNENDWKCLNEAFLRVAKIDSPFSDLIGQVSNLYSWLLIDDELVPSPVAESYIKTYGRQAATAANRHLQEIRVSKPIWRKMRSIDRAALIIHEILFSALPVPAANPTQQDPFAARHLTSEVFVLSATLDLRERLDGDHLDQPLQEGEHFKPTLFKFTTRDGEEQEGVFFRRVNVSGLDSALHFETALRHFYLDFDSRDAQEYEIYYWINQASHFQFTCGGILKDFLTADGIREMSNPEITEIAKKLMGKTYDPVLGSSDPRAEIRAHADEICESLGHTPL